MKRSVGNEGEACSPFRWFGSIESLATAAEVAASELGEIDGGWDAEGVEVEGGRPHCTARVKYEGGTFNADDMEELRAEVSALEQWASTKSNPFPSMS